MTANKLWLEEGLKVLTDEGARSVTIDRLAERVGLSKGSFYHHFNSMAGFKTALLAHFEAEHTNRLIDAVEGAGARSPRAKIDLLIAMVLSEEPESGGPELEVAIRAWALQDADVRAAQQRVDQIRIGYVRDLWFAMSGDATEALRMGRLIYLILIGAGHVIPPLTVTELRQLYDVALRLAPADKKARKKPTSTKRKR